MRIETFSGKKLSLMLKVLLAAMGVILIGAGLFFREYLNAVVGLILTYLASYEKDIIISEEGISILRKGFMLKNEELFPFSRLTNIRIEKLGEKTALHFMENHMARRILVRSCDVEGILSIVKKQNKNIYIDEVKTRKGINRL